LRLSIFTLRISTGFFRRFTSLLVVILAINPLIPAADSRALSIADKSFLDDLSRRSFRFFQEQTNHNTGLVRDRSRADGTPHDEAHRNVASIAATGFGLTALCIATQRRWVDRAEAREQARVTLRFFAERAPGEHGWFYHWLEATTGQRTWNSEVSSIDTALLLAGILTAKQFFHDDAEIVRLATMIYERVDFQWMQNGHPALLSHGWKPETGFLRPVWDSYSEETILYLLAIGSTRHPITPRAWWAWKRDWVEYAGYRYLAGAPALFIHQYSQAWIDYRGQRESKPPYVNYFENSVKATRAHRSFCIDLSKEFPGYSENIWGITASDSARGYVAWGGPPRDAGIDGTVVPAAAAGSLMFTPDICLPALRAMKDQFGEKIWGRYGFIDAFNPTTGWVDRDVIGLDVGITLLSAENLRSGTVWRWFTKNPEIQRAMKLAGFVAGNPQLKHRRNRFRIRTSIMSARDAFIADNLTICKV
jgi:hypothetical protein